MKNEDATPLFFATPSEFRAWLAAHHAERTVQWIGFYKKATGRPSITWPESVAEALCYGWIDGLRRKVDEEAYKIRFTPRKKTSIWSAINIKMMEELIAAGRIQPAGSKAWEARRDAKSAIYAYEPEATDLLPEFIAKIKENPSAWEFWEKKLAPGYKRTTIHWVMRAKRPETREKRLAILIESAAEGRKIPQLRREGE